MSVPEQTPHKEYTGNGVTNNFALEFTCDSKQELKVFIDNIEPELSTWSLVGGSVVFTTAPVSGSKIVLKRATKLERTTNYSSVDNSFRPDAINKDFDRVWYALQDQAYKLGQYDLDYSYAINTSNQALSNAATAQQKADSAYNLADTVNTETRPIERGGTGASTAVGARNNLNVYSQAEVDVLISTGGQGVVAGIANGGTGANTAAGARINLDVMSSTDVDAAINTATPPASTAAKGIIKLATQTEVNTGTDNERAVTPATLKSTFPIQTKSALNASGNAPIYACRAWVNFNGTGTPTIRASGNVSSITDNGAGNYTINFTTALPDANYAPQLASTSRANDTLKLTVTSSTEGGTPTLKTTTALQVNYGAIDLSEVYVSIFR